MEFLNLNLEAKCIEVTHIHFPEFANSIVFLYAESICICVLQPYQEPSTPTEIPGIGPWHQSLSKFAKHLLDEKVSFSIK